MANAAQATGPTLLVHGSDDGFVSVERSRDLAAALQAAGQDVRLDVVAGAGHGFDGYARAALTAAGRRSAEQILSWLSRS